MQRRSTQRFQALEKALNMSLEKTWETYECTLVTPMYGGGVETRRVDETMPIRASSIRGQLRFWWRIACGPNDSNELLKKETEIWGGISNNGSEASCVEIRVSDSQQVSFECFKGNKNTYIFGAAKEFSCLKSGYRFDLQLSYKSGTSPDVEKQIETALRWWGSFGGIQGGNAGVGLDVATVSGIALVIGVTASAPVLAIAAIGGAVAGGFIGGVAGYCH